MIGIKTRRVVTFVTNQNLVFHMHPKPQYGRKAMNSKMPNQCPMNFSITIFVFSTNPFPTTGLRNFAISQKMQPHLINSLSLILGQELVPPITHRMYPTTHQSAPLKVSGVAQTKCMSSNCPFFEKNFGTLPTD